MDISAVKTSVATGVSYGTQVNTAAQSVPGALPANADSKVSVAVQPVVASTNDKINNKTVKIDDLNRITAAINQFMDALDTDTNIHFKIHERTNELMVQIVDQKTDKVLREYPSKEFLDTIATIRTYVGLMLDKRI